MLFVPLSGGQAVGARTRALVKVEEGGFVLSRLRSLRRGWKVCSRRIRVQSYLRLGDRGRGESRDAIYYGREYGGAVMPMRESADDGVDWVDVELLE